MYRVQDKYNNPYHLHVLKNHATIVPVNGTWAQCKTWRLGAAHQLEELLLAKRHSNTRNSKMTPKQAHAMAAALTSYQQKVSEAANRQRILTSWVHPT